MRAEKTRDTVFAALIVLALSYVMSSGSATAETVAHFNDHSGVRVHRGLADRSGFRIHTASRGTSRSGSITAMGII